MNMNELSFLNQKIISIKVLILSFLFPKIFNYNTTNLNRLKIRLSDRTFKGQRSVQNFKNFNIVKILQA